MYTYDNNTTIVPDGSHFGCDVDNDAAVLFCSLCRLLTETTSTFLKERSKVLGHDQRAHCVGCQRGNKALHGAGEIISRQYRFSVC